MTMHLRLRAWFPRACMAAVTVAAAFAVWGAWLQLMPAKTGMPQWGPPFFMEGLTACALCAWCTTPRPSRRMHAGLGSLLACDAGALVAAHLLAVDHVGRTPFALSLAAVSALYVGMLAVWLALRDVADRSAARPKALAPTPTVAVELADLVGMIGHAVLGDIGPDAGNARTGTAVYRFFDVTRQPIYTGKSRNFTTRFKDHRVYKSWFDDVHHMTVVWYKDEASALAAEEKAIKAEGPLHNVIYNQRKK